ncbi:MAG: P27 family phage terminase small subunit [Cohnella sp.]|nr:P27 family phage terminase small subunit [Cohnella sp.]
MQHLGVYSDNYEDAIDIYVGMLSQYKVLEKQFEDSGCRLTEGYTNKAGATNDRKTPIYTAMESLRKDIAKYSDMLGLNPKAFEKFKKRDVPVRKPESIKPDKQPSKLELILGGSSG